MNEVRAAPSLRWLDAAAIAAIGVWAFVAFIGARDDFSYDYGNYIAYFEQLREFSADELLAQLESFFPYPYVLVPPAGFWEAGFAFLLWSLMGAGLTPAWAYAVVGTTSILLRTWLLRLLGLGWIRTLLLTVYSVTLFEANAIRLGCALTACIAALWALQRNRVFSATALLAIAASMHLQSPAFSLPLLLAYLAWPAFASSRGRRTALVILAVLASVLAAMAPDQLDIGKLAEYADITSASVGINLASVTGALAIGLALLRMARATAEQSRAQRVASATLLATLPALALLLLATQMGALGDRAWQFAFVALIATMPLARGGEVDTGPGRPPHADQVALLLCLGIAVVNVTLRYPLSNFFAPMMPHTPITPLILVM
jgi:EpsG family